MEARRRKGDREVTDVQLAAKVARVVEISRISLRAAEFRSSLDTGNPHPEKLVPHQQVGASHSLTDSGALRVIMSFALDLKPEPNGETDSEPTLKVRAEYEVEYQLPAGAAFAEKELTHFAQLNGTVNLWPYWRELVHTVAARVGIGSITLPVYRVKPKVVETLE